MDSCHTSHPKRSLIGSRAKGPCRYMVGTWALKGFFKGNTDTGIDVNMDMDTGIDIWLFLYIGVTIS